MCEIDDKLIALNRRGIFFGPHESEEAYFLRANALVKNQSASALIQNKFDTTPDWIETFTQSKGLSAWEGAATWIEEKPCGARSCQIQLKNSRLSRLYDEKEIVAHEVVHAMRLMFDENRFEEILAYQTSSNRFRRYFGPLFASTKESLWFILSMVIAWMLYITGIVFDLFGEYFLLAPGILLCASLIRLRRSQSVFSKALNNIAGVIRKDVKPLSLALRLTDREIALFAKKTPSEIHAYIQAQQGLRWRQLCLSYF